MEGYGNGSSTGLDQTAAGKITTGLASDDLAVSPEDRAILRRLAERVAAVAAGQRDRQPDFTSADSLRIPFPHAMG